LRGHAIECRIYAEDPDNSFFPSPGRISRLITPSGPGIREDSGVYEGWSVPLDYDPMLSKLIAYAPTREMAVARLLRALDEYFVGGIKTNLALFRRILRDKHFVAGRIDTGYLDRLLTEASKPPSAKLDDSGRVAAIAAAIFSMNGAGVMNSTADAGKKNGAPANGSEENTTWKRIARREALR
jgi:acetyl-CoA carboxylase biotin carboxylase subunit